MVNNISSEEPICDARFTRMINYSRLRPLWSQRQICYVGSFTDIPPNFHTVINTIIDTCYQSKIPLKLNKVKSKRKQDQEYVSQEISKDNLVNKLLKTILGQINTKNLLSCSVNNSVSQIKEIMSISNFSFYTSSFVEHYFRKNRKFINCISNIKRKSDLEHIFSNGKSVEYILTDYKNSFQQLEQIEEQCLKKEKDILFIISSGPMGKILNYNLTTQGYQCLDIGHL